jgi:transcriptional regulator with XRE-family HTH domain
MGSTLGQRLRALRVERGLSQADLAGDLVSASYVSLIESGRRSPERAVLDGLAGRLGCSATYLETGVVPEEINEQRLRLEFAEIALVNGAVDEAHQRFSELAHLASTEVRHGASWGLVRTEQARGNLHAALTHLEALIDAARAGEPGTPSLLTVLISRCRLYQLAGDISRSIDVGEHALREVRELGLEGCEDEIRLASTLVGSYWTRGDYFSAQHLASQAIERAERLGSHRAQGSVYWNACLVAEARGDLALALDLARKSLALISEDSPDIAMANLRINHAWLLLQSEPPELDEADALLARARDVLEDRSSSPYLARCETEMARSALLRGDFGTATLVAAQAAARCAEGDTESHNARVVGGLAQIMDGHSAEGIATVSDAARRLAAMGCRPDAAKAWRELAEALIERDQPAAAIDALRRAADCAGVRVSSIRKGAALPVLD